MAIEQRGIKVGSSRLAYGTPARDARMGVPRQTNWVGLAESLGVAVGGVKKDLEEEAKREAISKVHEINVKTAGKSPEERQKAIEDAKAGLGAGRGFFSKLLIDEDEEVKAFDEASWSMRAVDTKRESERMVADLQSKGKSYKEIQDALSVLYNKRLDEASSVSDSAKNSYLKGITDHVGAMNQDLWRREEQKVQEAKVRKMDEHLNKMTHDAIGQGAGISVDEMVQADTPEKYNEVKAKVNANMDSIVSNVTRSAEQTVALGKSQGLNGAELRRKVATEYMDTASLYQSPEMYEALMSKTTGGGKSPKDHYPEEYATNMRILRSNQRKYEDALTERYSQVVKDGNDKAYTALIGEGLEAINRYQREPSEENRTFLEGVIKQKQAKYDELKARGAFEGNTKQEREWIKDIRYNESLLIKSEPIQSYVDEAKRHIAEKTITKSWLYVYGKYLDPETRIKAQEDAERYDKLQSESARSSLRRQEEITRSEVEATKNTYQQGFESLASSDLVNASELTKGTLTSITNRFNNESRTVTLKAIQEFEAEGGDYTDSAGVAKAVNDALRKEFGDDVKKLEEVANSEKRILSSEGTSNIIDEGSEEEIRNAVEDNGWSAVPKNKSALIKTLKSLNLSNREEMLDYMDRPEFSNVVTNDRLKKLELIDEVFLSINEISANNFQ